MGLVFSVAALGCAGQTGRDGGAAGSAGGAGSDGGVVCREWQHIELGATGTRQEHATAWTGTELFVWGGASYTHGCLSSGWRVDLDTLTVRPTPEAGAPTARIRPHAFWGGSEVLVMGGRCSSGYEPNSLGWDPATDSWVPMTSSPHFGRDGGATVSAGDGRVFLIGGFNGNDFGDRFWDDGWEFSPLSYLFPISVDPLPRNWVLMASGWTGTEVVLWGGQAGETSLDPVGAGFRYEPLNQVWRKMNDVGAPSARQSHSLAVSGDLVLIWGGASLEASAANDGAIYSLTTDTWRPITMQGAPTGRFFHTATIVNGKMVIFGGSGVELERPDGSYDIGGVYDIDQDTWMPLPGGPCSPPPLTEHTATAVGKRLVIWGGGSKERPDLPEAGWIIDVE